VHLVWSATPEILTGQGWRRGCAWNPERSAAGALAAGAARDEIAEVLLVIASVVGLGLCYAPLPAWRPLGYDVAAALEGPADI